MNAKRSVFRTATTVAVGSAVLFLTSLPNPALGADDPPSGAQPPGQGANGELWLPAGARDVLKMHKGGIAPDVLMHYIDSSRGPFHLSADGVIYLQQQGLPTKVITELMERDSALQQQGMSAIQNVPPGGPPPGAFPPGPPQNAGMAMPQTPPPVIGGYPPPDATAVAPAYPDYSYYAGYPYYGYPYYWGGYWGPGWGWGRGWGYGGFRGGFHGGFRGGGGFHGGGGHR
jgi:hypothetical protein